MTREEAIEQIEKAMPCMRKDTKDALGTLIPELAESEDERIRKIIHLALIASEDELSDFYKVHKIHRKECTDWLEKQKEQKPVTKDGQQECPYKDLVLVKDFFGKYKRKCKLSNKACDSKECEQWNELQAEFKRINEAFENGKNEVINRPEVFGLQKSAEWSEEDEKMLRTIISDGSRGVKLDSKQIDFLKSLRPQLHWKPGEEQMKALEDAKMRMLLDGYGLCPLL